VRGRGIAMVFQNAHSSLNPALKIGAHLAAVLRYRRGLAKADILQESKRLLADVGLADVDRILAAYSHELSGGMSQRVAIALALACRPQLLIADEPTSNLDVTVAALLIELLRELRKRLGLAILLISHDLGVIARLCDRVSVMYLGRIVESASASDLYRKPLHPYTEALLQSVLVLDPTQASTKMPNLASEPLSTIQIPEGQCRFAPRCPKKFARCLTEDPPLVNEHGRLVACWLYPTQS
jgi:peptide/nickel transport system ATP-binding protein